ncbi:unnamed protein product [Phytophthora lilii]|uniref:Unnamed protein product n=1 Tax=Phytophthora lilii TaxID=2077276 RepID=A0A9W6WZP4_9STRA|nr:unnamed protein product [Phytophthora lilii]
MSSGFSYPQPSFQSSIYNPAFYLSLDSIGYLTYDYAQILYLSLTIGGYLSFSGSSRSISITGTSSYIDCREYRQSGTMYDLGLFEYINGVSFGSATPNKFLLCDSSSNIGGLSAVTATTLSCTNVRQGLTYYDFSSFITSIPTSLSLNDLSTSGDISCSGVINGSLAYGNQSAITTVGSLTELGINSTATNDNHIERDLDATNNNLRIGVNNSTSMILTTTGRLGLGTTSPSATLHVPGCNSFVFGAGGTTVYRLRTDSGATESALGPITYQWRTMPFTFRISKRKDKKYDAVFHDGRLVSFGGIKRNDEPYQQYRDSTPLRAFSKYDHGKIEQNQQFYKRHGPIDNSKPYTASWFSKKYLW